MSHQEPGDGRAYPVSFQIPDDGDSRNAASVNVAFEALADRTEWLKPARAELDSAAALNYGQPVALSMIANGAFYNFAQRRWVVCGDAAAVKFSRTGGFVWDAAETLTGNAGEKTLTGDADGSGNLVITTDTRYVFTYNASSFTWARVDARGVVITAIPAVVTYDPVAALWCLVQEGVVRTSADRSTWTTRTSPVGWPTSFATPALCRSGVRKSTGRTVAVCVDGSTQRFGYSSDGGVNWTTLPTYTTAISTPTEACLIPLIGNGNGGANLGADVSQTWLYVVGQTTGTGSSEVWRSVDDGASWQKIATLANSCLMRIASVGGVGNVVVGAARTSTELVASFDAGVTWRATGTALSATVRGAFAGDGGALVLTSGLAYPPFRTSATPGTILT